MTVINTLMFAEKSKPKRSGRWGTWCLWGLVWLVVGPGSGCQPGNPAAERSSEPAIHQTEPSGPAAEVAEETSVRSMPAEQKEQETSPVERPMLIPAETPPVEAPLVTSGWTTEQLQGLGISEFQSQRFRLLVDRLQEGEREEFANLPALMEEFLAWVQQTWPELAVVVPLESRPLTGLVMRERAMYRQAGLLPEDLGDLSHGIARGQEFWMLDQPTAYYRAHLLLHELMHCLLNQQPHQWPVWFQEGVCELVGNHEPATTPGQRTKFAVMPGQAQVAGGFGRIQILQQEMAQGRMRTLADVQKLNLNNFYPHKASYGWSWALCDFLTRHPQTAAEFPRLFRHRTARAFAIEFDRLVPRDDRRLQADWFVFVQGLEPGYDFARSRIDWDEMTASDSLAGAVEPGKRLQADRNWQRSGWQVQPGERYRITAEGSCVLATTPEPWVSEPQGVSIEYYAGRPLGEVQMAVFHPAVPGPEQSSGFEQVIPIGRGTEFTAEQAGELFFRINDAPSQRGDNSGEFVLQRIPI